MDTTLLDDPFGGAASRPPRRGRAAAVFTLVALVAGFGGGFAAGYVVYGDAATADTVEAAGAGPGAPAGTEPGLEPRSPSETTSATAVGSAAPESAVATTADGDLSHGLPVRERLLRRTSAGGYSIRAFRTTYPRGDVACPEGSWCPPPQCHPTAQIDVYVVGDWSVVQAGAALFDVRDGETARVLGVIHDWYGGDDPVFGVIVRTATGVRTVRLRSGGATDEMTPIDGVAVLATPGDVTTSGPVVPPSDARIEVVDASGSVRELSVSGTGRPDPECLPPPPAPPALPAPGDQPADPATEEAAVRQLVQDVFGPEDRGSIERLVIDPSGLTDLRDRLATQHEDLTEGIGYEVGDVVFTGPTEAAYHFRPVIPNYAEFSFQVGHARVVDGRWMMTRDTVCTMFALGGARC